MNKRRLWRCRSLSVVLMAASGLSTVTVCAQGSDEEIPFADAKLFFQMNDTDGDLGIHAIIDGEPWKKLSIEGANERELLDITTRGTLRYQGLTELRFESAEPTFDELDPEEFFGRFPEGEYEIEGTTLEGDELESTVQISHVLPAAPENLRVAGQETPEDCDDGPVPSVRGRDITISWDAVAESHPEIGSAGPVQIVRYEVAVEREEPTALSLTAELPPSVTELVVPPGLLEEGDEIKFQILATDAGGNETSAESCFEVE